MPAAIWVLSGFATAWSIGAIVILGWPLWLIAGPLAISGSLFFAASRMPASTGRSRQFSRLILTWTVIEFAAIILIANLLEHFHRRDAINPAVVIIVGAHLIPLARGINYAPYYWAAAGLMIIGSIGLFLVPPASNIVSMLGAACVLWATSLTVLRTGSRPVS